VGGFLLEPGLSIGSDQVIHNPDHAFYKEFLKPYYEITKDGQYLFGSTQPGRRPDRAFYMIPPGYKLGKNQQPFDTAIGKHIYRITFEYLQTERPELIVQEGIQGEHGYEVGLRVVISVSNPHSAYIAWMGKLMIFPPKKHMTIDCWNYIIPEPLPSSYIKDIQDHWPDYDPTEPLTLYDLTQMKKNKRRVISLGVDYFGGAYKKPNLTMVWNKAESDGLISYHAGCTKDRVLKGLSGTGKTTLTVGPDLEQDDACLGYISRSQQSKMTAVTLIGLEAASFAKSQGLTSHSPEYPGLMKSTQKDAHGHRPIVLAMNIDCEGVDYSTKSYKGYQVKIPKQLPGHSIGSLQCTKYEKSGTTNGRFIFLFSELNPQWGKTTKKQLKTVALSFKKYDILEPIFRVTDPFMAVALDSACESIITSAVSGRKPGTRVRSYAATDFMAREQSQQALLKLEMYQQLDLGLDGSLVFFINNAGYVGEYDMKGNQIKQTDESGNPIPKLEEETGEIAKNELGEIQYRGRGEKVRVDDSKQLIDLIEHRKITQWITHPVFQYLIPHPQELEERFGMTQFGIRFNPLNYYTAKQYLAFVKRDITERTHFLKTLFKGQHGEDTLSDVIHVWERCTIPDEKTITDFYSTNYQKKKLIGVSPNH